MLGFFSLYMYCQFPSHEKVSYLLQLDNLFEALFGCCRIHLNPHVLEWIGVEFSSSSTPIHPNTYGLMRIRLHPNKA